MRTFAIFSFLIAFTIAVFSASCIERISENFITPGISVTPVNDTIKTYTNPVGGITGIGDPYILKYDGKYYLYATSSDIGFKVWKSYNMVDWIESGLALNRNSVGNNWGKGNFWAPEVKFYNNKFYMNYSAISDNGKMKLRIAVSDNPLGPFINSSEPFFNDNDFSYIDGDLFFDNNKVYFFFVKDCSQNIINGRHISQIHVVELTSDLKTMIGQPKLILTPDQDWEGINGDWQWNEGPFVLKHDNIYYLMYSANVYDSPDYSVGYASATTPMGLWVKYPGNPILKKDLAQKISGPGHNCVTSSPDDKELFVVYHTHTYFDKPSGNRNVCIDRLYFENGEMKIIGPTRTSQPLPSGSSPRIVQKNKN